MKSREMTRWQGHDCASLFKGTGITKASRINLKLLSNVVCFFTFLAVEYLDVRFDLKQQHSIPFGIQEAVRSTFCFL